MKVYPLSKDIFSLTIETNQMCQQRIYEKMRWYAGSNLLCFHSEIQLNDEEQRGLYGRGICNSKSQWLTWMLASTDSSACPDVEAGGGILDESSQSGLYHRSNLPVELL